MYLVLVAVVAELGGWSLPVVKLRRRCQLEAVVARVSVDNGPGALCVVDMLQLAPHLYWNIMW